MITRNQREWCAMLAKLVAPMDPETAAKAFVDMLPMLPPDDTLYTRDTLDKAATCERRTSVPTFADISGALGQAAKDRLPANVRMGYVPPAWPALAQDDRLTPEQREEAIGRVQAIKAELAARGSVAKGVDEAPKPKYLTPLQLAMDAKRRGLVLRPDLARALAEHEASVSQNDLAG